MMVEPSARRPAVREKVEARASIDSEELNREDAKEDAKNAKTFF